MLNFTVIVHFSLLFILFLSPSTRWHRKVLSNMIQRIAKSKLIAAGLAVLPLVALMGIIPNQFSTARAEVCQNAPTTPTFNPYPVTVQDGNSCTDFPLIRMKVIGGQYPQSIAEVKQGITAKAGDYLYATMWIHNGADPSLPASQVTAKNTRLLTQVSEGTGSEQTVKAYITADNADEIVTQTYNVHIGANDRLEVVPNSGERFNHLGALMESGFQVGNYEASLGDLEACFEHAMFIRFQIKVVGSTPTNQNTTLGITKEVRDITTNTSFASSTEAKNGDTVEYRVRVKNTGTAVAQSVFMTDNLSNSGINITGQPTVSVNYTGQLQNGLSLGDMNPGAEVTITYRGTVTRDSISVTNVAVANAGNASRVEARATVNVPVPSKGNIVITKQVRNITQNSSLAKSINAKSGDTVEYSVNVSVNSGRVQNVVYTDTLPNGFSLNSSSVRINGNSVSGSQATNANLGTMNQGQSATITFQGTVSGNNTTLTNTACAVGDNVSQTCDNASVVLQNVVVGQPNIVQSKKAWNDTKNQNAESTSAVREDYITYTLTVTNTGTANAESYVIQDDLSGVLPFADMIDNGGGTLNGNVISYAPVTVPQGGSVSKTFKVRVKYNLPANLNYQLVNTYGNTVRINVVGPQVTGPIVAPKTGVDAQTAAGVGGIFTAGAGLFLKRRELFKFILNSK